LSIAHLIAYEKNVILDCGTRSKGLWSSPNTIASFHMATQKRRNV
jgi:hypothetical protein